MFWVLIPTFLIVIEVQIQRIPTCVVLNGPWRWEWLCLNIKLVCFFWAFLIQFVDLLVYINLGLHWLMVLLTIPTLGNELSLYFHGWTMGFVRNVRLTYMGKTHTVYIGNFWHFYYIILIVIEDVWVMLVFLMIFMSRGHGCSFLIFK